MAEQVQALMERMVTPLRDLRDRGIFSEEEIHQIVTRRRSSEYLLQKLSVTRSDYLRYIEAEILLEKLRKLRKQKVLQEWRQKMRNGELLDNDNNETNSSNASSKKGGKKQKQHAYQTSGPGDAHILSNIHFLYQRLLKKFHYPLDVILNYAEFAKEHKSFNVMSRVYAEGLQRHPREEGLWIQAASFEFFGYVARDDDKSESTKLVGSSIQNARILMQRGLRINGKTSQELWIQYFALELHYVIKLMGRKEILEGIAAEDENSSEEDDDNEDAQAATRITNTKLLPCQIIYKNAIKSIPDSLSFRLRFVETCRMFPHTNELECHIIESIERDFGDSVEAWVSRISFAEDLMKKRGIKNVKGGVNEGFLGMAGVNDEEEEPRAKKRRVVVKDTALELLNEALEAVPTAQMYLECAKYLQLRIQRLEEFSSAEDVEEDEEPEDVSYLLSENEDVGSAMKRHLCLLKELYANAEAAGAHSCSLTFDQVEFLSNNDEMEAADDLLNRIIVESGRDINASLFIRWANLSRDMIENKLIPKLSPAAILRMGLGKTPIHDRDAFLLLSSELMKQLMSQPRCVKDTKELNSVFQKLLLVSQGISRPNRNEDSSGDEIEVNLAEIFLAYLQYTIPEGNCTVSDNECVRAIYNSVIFHSNFANSCIEKSSDELLAMKSFFDLSLHFEKSIAAAPEEGNKQRAKKQQKQILSNLYGAAISFFGTGGGDTVLRSVLDGYQRDLDDMKFGL